MIKKKGTYLSCDKLRDLHGILWIVQGETIRTFNKKVSSLSRYYMYIETRVYVQIVVQVKDFYLSDPVYRTRKY